MGHNIGGNPLVRTSKRGDGDIYIVEDKKYRELKSGLEKLMDFWQLRQIDYGDAIAHATGASTTHYVAKYQELTNCIKELREIVENE